MGKIRQTFPLEVKRRAIQLYEEGTDSHSIAKELGLSCHKIVLIWIKHYENEGISGLAEKRGKRTGPRPGRPGKRPLSLEEENGRLRAENEFFLGSVNKYYPKFRK